MHLLIRAVSLAGQPLTQAISAYFDERGGTIGRSDTNTLALPDPERRISRLQAEVSLTPEGWRILNVGNANPIWHNNRPVPPGDGVMLGEGDELQIGTYALRVNHSQNDETARTITKGRATIDSRTVIASSGLEPKTDSGRMLPEGRVTVTGPGAAPALAPAAPVTAQPSAQAATPATLPHIPTGFGLPTSASAAPVPSAAPASPFADLLGDLAAGSASATPPGAGPAPSSASPFADILGFGASPALSSAPSPMPPAAPTPMAPAAASWAAASPAVAVAAPAVARLPDDFDPFADLMPATPSGRPAAPSGSWDLPAAAQPAGKTASPFDPGAQPASLPGDLDLLGVVQPQGAGSIDQLFGLGGKPSGASHDPLADFLRKTEPAAPAEAAVGAPSHVDPLALLHRRDELGGRADDAAPAEAAGPALPDDVPELNAAMPLPAAAHREPLSASFTFMPPSRAAASAAPAGPAEDDDEDTRPAELDMAFDLPTAPKLSATPLETQLAPESVSARPTLPDMDLSPVPVSPARPTVAVQQAAVSQAMAASTAQMSEHVPEHVAAHEPAPVPAPMPGSADAAALWTAFCEGAGVKFVPPQGLNPDLMRIMGQVLRNAVDGSLKLVAARAATKQEMRAEVTVIQARRNNPLKFSPDTQSAMEQLLQPPLRGFMSGPEAVADAMDDLLGHTIGTMVGMRAALEGVLARFEPAQLEAKLVGHSMLDSLLPMNRRAKLWELYLQHFEAVKAEAQDDFHNLFGRAFLQAYEEQLDRLEAERREAGRAPGSPA